MSSNIIGGFPSQQLSYTKKTTAWRKKCVDFGDNHSLMHYHLTRKSVKAMNINYDLLNGKIHMDDLKLIINPFDLNASFIPDSIQHYPIINSKLEVLKGEESKRLFDFRVIITNANAVSEIEEKKNVLVNQRLQELIENSTQDEQTYQQELEKLSDYFQYNYQDKREIRGNLWLNHYIKELELPQLFNKGFEDAYAVGEEIYQIDIVGGEPTVERLDPREVRILRNGSSTKIEDADIIIIEQYWNPGKVIDTYADVLSKKDIAKIENGLSDGENAYTDSMDNIDSRYGMFPIDLSERTAGDSVIDVNTLFESNCDTTLTPYDSNGNIRVLRVYWKSRRKIKKVKSYNIDNGEEEFNFYPEDYVCDPSKGEEEQSFWVNEAWEGTKIGSDIYVNMGPKIVQYNRLSNPSKCHFGIIGSIYNTNGDSPFSLVDIMKPYAYLYDVYHDRLNKVLAKNVGKVIRLDFAKIPNKWTADQWLYYLNVNGIAVEDSFKEGTRGVATGKLAGSLNNASSGIIDGSLGSEIQQYISILEWISTKAGDLAGISKQREGQISNRETVGGVERATLQSSHSTEWLFFPHESVKKRVLECLLETAKIAYKGRKVKFDYILTDGAKAIMEMDGDEFAECDYGLVVDSSNGIQELNQKLDTLAQAALQNQTLDFSTIMKLYTTTSLAEKQRMVEANERRIREQQQQQLQMQQQQQQAELQQKAQEAQAKLAQEYKMHQEKLETQIMVAEINSQAEAMRFAMMQGDNTISEDKKYALEKDKLSENVRQFEAKLALNRKKHEDDIKIKEKQLQQSNKSKN